MNANEIINKPMDPITVAENILLSVISRINSEILFRVDILWSVLFTSLIRVSDMAFGLNAGPINDPSVVLQFGQR